MMGDAGSCFAFEGNSRGGEMEGFSQCLRERLQDMSSGYHLICHLILIEVFSCLTSWQIPIVRGVSRWSILLLMLADYS
jgi:hypothetical protein